MFIGSLCVLQGWRRDVYSDPLFILKLDWLLIVVSLKFLIYSGYKSLNMTCKIPLPRERNSCIQESQFNWIQISIVFPKWLVHNYFGFSNSVTLDKSLSFWVIICGLKRRRKERIPRAADLVPWFSWVNNLALRKKQEVWKDVDLCAFVAEQYQVFPLTYTFWTLVFLIKWNE